MKKTKMILFLAVTLILVLILAACGEEMPETTVQTTESIAQTESNTTALQTTAPVTSTLVQTEAPITEPKDAWKAKLEKDFFDKAVMEDQEYYVYMTYTLDPMSTTMNCNQQFIDAYVADKQDVVFANLDRAMASKGIYLRASLEEIEEYAKNPHVTGIYSYPQDKVIDGCTAQIERMDAMLLMPEMWDYAGGGGTLPFVEINSKEEFMAFVDACIVDDRVYSDDAGSTNFQSNIEYFLEVTAAAYDDAFFAEKTLFLIGSENGTGSEKYSLIHVLNDNGVKIVLDLSCSYMMTSDVARWLIFVEVENTAIEGQNSFEVIIK